ncbi:O-antigen ligase [Colwellia sp. Bg11-12]|uniref:O-antigen ligase family protein n=1 Tax=Colwellia sp. Bg11-12 TaxID=2759817 RepID=UPI0015F7732E|nr:O-antigen ligase family protein [Colwellia sp. Bg11-12]MBA6265141.1 O-antigen ligase family protein [Colwellia sp. Bg11-12]
MARTFPPAEKNASFAFFFLALYTIAVFIRPHEFSIETSKYVVIKVFAILAFLLTLTSLRPIKILPQHYMLLGFTPLIMISAFLNGWGMDGITEANKFFVASIIPFFLYSSLITSISRQKILMLICIAAALIMVYNGHIQQQSFDGKFGYGIGDSLTVGRAEMRITYLGFFGDPNDLGMFLVMNLAFLGYFYSEKGALYKLLMPIFFGLFCYGVLMTGSRGTLLGTLGVIFLYFFIKKAGAKLIVFGLIMAPILATLLTKFGGMSSSESSANGRLEAWYSGILMLINNPIFGVGKGNFMDHHELVAHNSYIHVAGEMGIPGYSLWAGVIILTMLASYRVIKEFSIWPDDNISEETKTDYFAEVKINQTLFFSMLGFIITAFFLSRQFTLLLFVFLGMLTASHIRLMKLRPELKSLFCKDMIIKSMTYCWVIIIAVYMALKVGL